MAGEQRTCRNSGSFLWILERIVRAPYSRLLLASQQGTTLCASTSWKGMSIFLATCAHQGRLLPAPSVSVRGHVARKTPLDRAYTSVAT